MYNNLYDFIYNKKSGLAWLKLTMCQEKHGSHYFISGSGGGQLCASVVIVVSDISVQEYSDLCEQDDTCNHIFGDKKSF